MSPATVLKSVKKSPLKHAWTWAAWCVFLSVLGATAAYYHTFSQRRPFDDEGMLMDWIGSFIQRQALYKDVHTFYGPAFYLYESLAHTALGTMPNATSVRIISIVFWLTSTLLIFVLVRRVTQNWVLALAAYLLAFRTARFLGEEPGHPQELCLLLIVAIAFVVTGNWRKPGPRSARRTGRGAALHQGQRRYPGTQCAWRGLDLRH